MVQEGQKKKISSRASPYLNHQFLQGVRCQPGSDALKILHPGVQRSLWCQLKDQAHGMPAEAQQRNNMRMVKVVYDGELFASRTVGLAGEPQRIPVPLGVVVVVAPSVGVSCTLPRRVGLEHLGRDGASVLGGASHHPLEDKTKRPTAQQTLDV